MKLIIKLFTFLFGFSKKYHKKEEKYHKSCKRGQNSSYIFEIITNTILVLGSVVGVILLFKANEIFWAIFVSLVAVSLFTTLVPETFIIGLVAFRHRLRSKIETKIENAVIDAVEEQIREAVEDGEASEAVQTENNENVPVENKEEREARGSNKLDITIGVMGIVCGVLQVVGVAGILLFYLVKGISSLPKD